ncbi:MAG TPA: hypothetical protein VGI78_11505 [Acetobacteraceae bacterium]
MSREYYVCVSLRGRIIVAGFFGLCVYETATAHARGPMVVFLIPAGLATYAASRLLFLKLGVVFWH